MRGPRRPSGFSALTLQGRRSESRWQLTPVTQLGALYVNTYAKYAGLSTDAYLGQLGETLTAERVATYILDLATDDDYDALAYLLTANGINPLDEHRAEAKGTIAAITVAISR